MSWPPRSSRGQQGGQGQGGTNSLPLGAINDPMDMGQMRNSLNNIGKNSSATFGNMSQVKYQYYNSAFQMLNIFNLYYVQARGYAPSDAGSIAMSARGGSKFDSKYSNGKILFYSNIILYLIIFRLNVFK